jgi:EAL domain-containing protein (putative c-di-GMP-specific phosphodiesterase class I)
MRHADIAMYRAKRTGAGWAEYEPGRDSPAEVRLQELDDLDRAIGEQGLHLAYQPIVARPPADGPATSHVEALVRWQHPRHGALLPAGFLPLAAQSGRMGPLTDTVLDLALDDLSRWLGEGRDVQVSVNVGAEVLAATGFLPALERRLSVRGLPPAALCLELTESEVLSPEGSRLLQHVRATGMTVALDDFGTGYSSLSSLADLPLDRLKLDRSFVQRLSAGARMARFVGGLVGLVHGLGLPGVAEGVARQAEADLLDELGVAYQQGFLHSRPVLAEALPALWSSESLRG